MLGIFFARCLVIDMARTYMPDGVFSIQWMFFWLALALVVLAIALLLVRRETFLLQRLSSATSLVAASFAIFQVDLPFTGADVADYNARTERVRR